MLKTDGAPSTVADINGGKMDGFIGQQEEGSCHAKRALTLNVTPNVALILPDFQM